MDPLMLAVVLPDDRQVSRVAFERHAILTARQKRVRAPRPGLRALRPVRQS